MEEGLGRTISSVADHGLLKDIKVSTMGGPFSHFQFIEYTLIMGIPITKKYHELKSIIDTFLYVSF